MWTYPQTRHRHWLAAGATVGGGLSTCGSNSAWGAPQTGHASGGSGPRWTYPQTVHRHAWFAPGIVWTFHQFSASNSKYACG